MMRLAIRPMFRPIAARCAVPMIALLAVAVGLAAPAVHAQATWPQPAWGPPGCDPATAWPAPRVPSGTGAAPGAFLEGPGGGCPGGGCPGGGCPGGVCSPGVVGGGRHPRTSPAEDAGIGRMPDGRGDCPGGACQRPTQRTPRFYEPAVQISKGNAGGSGVVIGYRQGQAVVLTAWHVVEGPGRLSVVFPGQQKRFAGRLIAHDAALDLAALLVDVDFAPAVAPLAHGEPATGEAIVVAGFGGGQWRERAGNVLGVFDHAAVRACDLGVSPLSIPGDSGGPIYAPTGDLVSILWGGPARGPGGPLVRTQGARTLELRRFAEKLNLPFCLTPNTQQLQQAIEDIRAAQAQLQTRLLEIERQRDSLIRTIEQGDHATAQQLLADVRKEMDAARAEINAAKAEAASAQTVAAEVRGETSGLRKLIDQAFQRIAEAAQQQPEASLPEILKEAGLATARDVAASKAGEERIDRLIAAVLAAQEAKTQGESPGTAAFLTYLEALGLPAGLIALAAAIWKRRKE